MSHVSETERNKELARLLMGPDISQGDESVAEVIIHPDFFDHTNPPGMQHGLEGHKAIVRLFRTVFPDLQWDIDDLIAEGDKVVARTTMRGTHRETSSASRPPAGGSRCKACTSCASPTAASSSTGAATTTSA